MVLPWVPVILDLGIPFCRRILRISDPWIQDPGVIMDPQILDPKDLESRIFLGYWHMSADSLQIGGIGRGF